MRPVDASARHLRLLTETIAAVNSSLDLQEVLELVASKVADALGTDACFVYLYDEHSDELVLRATHGTRVEELTRTPRMRPDDIHPGRTVPEMLEADLKLERQVRAALAKGIALCEQHKDFVSRDMLKVQLADTEEDHAYWLEKQLGLIEKIGLPNYLQTQAGGPSGS